MISLEQYIKQHYSPTLIYGYLRIIRCFSTYMNNNQEKATYNDILAYIGYLRGCRLSPRSIYDYLHAVKVYYNYLVETGQREDHPCKRLTLKDRINRSIPVESLYSMDTLEHLLQTHQAKDKTLQKRDECVISLLIYQGLTTLEISVLDVEDISLEGGTVRVKAGRSNLSRTLSLKSSQVMTFCQYINNDRPKLLSKNKTATQSDKKRLIVSYSGRPILPINITDILNPKRQNKPKIVPQKIRQSVIAHLLREGHNVRVVQVFAGHRRASTTESYKQTGLDNLRASIQKYHPLG